MVEYLIFILKEQYNFIMFLKFTIYNNIYTKELVS